MALRRAYLEDYGQTLPLQTLRERSQGRDPDHQMFVPLADKTQVPTSPSVLEAVFRHSLPDYTVGSVQTSYSFQAG